MTRDECGKILAIIAATYPRFDADDPTSTVDAWYFFLADHSFTDISMALKIYVNTADSPYPPSASQLIGQINKVKALSGATEVDIWREVRPAIRNGLYHFEEEYEKLSETAKKMVGDPQQLREWAMLPSEDIDTVVQSNFKSRFKAMQTRQAEINAMPNDIRNLIEKSTKQIGVSE